MDYQPTDQPVSQPVNQPMNQNPESVSQGFPTKTLYIIVALVAVALVAWYFYSPAAPTTGTESTAVGPQAPVASGNTTAAITNDLIQIPDSTTAFNQDAAASAAAVSTF